MLAHDLFAVANCLSRNGQTMGCLIENAGLENDAPKSKAGQTTGPFTVYAVVTLLFDFDSTATPSRYEHSTPRLRSYA